MVSLLVCAVWTVVNIYLYADKYEVVSISNAHKNEGGGTVRDGIYESICHMLVM